MKGAKYDIYNDDNYVTTLVTDDNGTAKTKLAYGKYIIKEVEAPKGYYLDDKVYEFEISGSNLNNILELTDSKIYVDFSINKKDKESKVYLEGAKYGIYKDDKLVEELITDSNGFAKTKLEYGTYVIREIEAPKGYEIDSTEYNVIIDSIGKNYSLELDDMKIYVDLDISKKSTYNNEYLSDAIYGIYKDGELISKVETNDSIKTIKLPFGEYEIKELVAPAGYKLDNNTYKLIIDSNKKYELNLVDDKIVIEVPNTGLKKNNIGCITFILGSIGLLYGKKKYYLH